MKRPFVFVIAVILVAAVLQTISAAPIPAESKRVTTVAENGALSLPNTFTARLARREDANDFVLPALKRSDEDSADERGEAELYPRVSIRAALRANLETIKEAGGESAKEAIDSAGIENVVGTSRTVETLKLNAKSRRITKPQKHQQRPLKTWTKERLGAAEINALTDAELREIVLDHRRGTWHDDLPIETHKRMLSVLPPRLHTRRNFRELQSAQGTPDDVKSITKLRYKMRKQIEEMELSEATSSASSPLVPASVADPSQSAEAPKIHGKSKAITKAAPHRQTLDTSGWSRSDWVNHIDSLNDAGLRELILTRTGGGHRPGLPMRIYERMLKVLSSPPLPTSKAAKNFDFTPETVEMAKKVKQHRADIKRRISKLAPEAANAPSPTRTEVSLPQQAQPARFSAFIRPMFRSGPALMAERTPSTEQPPPSLLAGLAHLRELGEPRAKPHGSNRGAPSITQSGSTPFNSAPLTPITAEKPVSPRADLFGRLFGSTSPPGSPRASISAEKSSFDLNSTPPSSPVAPYSRCTVRS